MAFLFRDDLRPKITVPSRRKSYKRYRKQRRTAHRRQHPHNDTDFSESVYFRGIDIAVSVVVRHAQQHQQGLEHVVDVQIQLQRGHHVVRLAAVDDLLDVIEHVQAEHDDG